MKDRGEEQEKTLIYLHKSMGNSATQKRKTRHKNCLEVKDVIYSCIKRDSVLYTHYQQFFCIYIYTEDFYTHFRCLTQIRR